jgi:hypothetical protein
LRQYGLSQQKILGILRNRKGGTGDRAGFGRGDENNKIFFKEKKIVIKKAFMATKARAR